jgi:hypothetical protein
MNDDARLIELDRLENQAKRDIKRTHSIYFNGENQNLPVFKVDINLPLFRMENGRTKRKQIEFIYKNPNRAKDLDDPSSSVAQAIQEEILQEMASEADLLELLKQGQHEPLLLRHDGYVVNGNRRLAAMRLLHGDPQKYKNSSDFSFVDVARLPDLDEKEIRRIEQRLQMSQDGKADYNWVDELLTIQANIEDFGMTIPELAKDMNKKKSTVENQLRMLTLIDIYLDRSNKKGQYFVVEGDEQAFKTLAQGHARFEGDASKQTLLLDYAFPIILENQAGESKHKRIGKIVENFPQIQARVYASIGSGRETVETPKSIDILSSLPELSTVQDVKLALNESSSDMVHEVIRSIDRERELEHQANGPAEAVAQAATLLKNVHLTESMTKVKQFRGQLKTIRKTCDDLLEKLENIENNSIDSD